ncbi:IclR family transcriptional regulator [Achromobacter aloeverae]|uniref:IclR family transcriptional regulator n=1 Tax=Achromobacter aloeverae TaxID=1750518 RepID=UPI001F014D37|nr:IclR family transcriptional regulator [Achromobacter aloeverae]
MVRALALLDAFGIEDSHLSLAELARRTALPKTTVFRLAHTLAQAGYLVQLENAGWRLGPAAAWLSARYHVAFDLHDVLEPILRDLARATGETTSFFAHDGNSRVRLIRVRGHDDFASSSRVGQSLPLTKGSAGKVILAFEGEPGAQFEQIRRQGYWCTLAEMHPGAASVAAPVFGGSWKVIGALCVAGPADRLGLKELEAYAPAVMQAARKASGALAMSGASRRAPSGKGHAMLSPRRP